VLFKKLFLISRQLTLLPLEKAILFFRKDRFKVFSKTKRKKLWKEEKKSLKF